MVCFFHSNSRFGIQKSDSLEGSGKMDVGNKCNLWCFEHLKEPISSSSAVQMSKIDLHHWLISNEEVLASSPHHGGCDTIEVKSNMRFHCLLPRLAEFFSDDDPQRKSWSSRFTASHVVTSLLNASSFQNYLTNSCSLWSNGCFLLLLLRLFNSTVSCCSVCCDSSAKHMGLDGL